MWDQAETITETFGSTTRTRKNTFDNAGRPLTSEETSTVDKAFPKVTDEYNKETGALEKQSTTTESKTKTITSLLNTLGQLTSYTDADGATTKYKYDVDGRTEEVSDSKGYQIYSYDPATGFLTKLLDSAAGTFTASYDGEGKMLTENYPNGMKATYTVNPDGQDIKGEYEKTTHCTSSCIWFSDAVVPSIHGETLAQTSTLSSEIYTYDRAGRLMETQETPAGKGCVTRFYAYDEESNRRSLTTREPGSKGECATTGGTVERHIYDPANRLLDSGVSYEALGNTTNLPASDAGSNELTSSYYVDSQVASQTQNGETINYNYDPAGRTRETISSGKTASTVITHYDGPGNALSGTSESTEKWTRNIPGIGGEVTAIQTNAGTPVLQLHDLNGNIVATAALSETETKLLSSYNSTEFGVPTTSNPPKYSWLGADGIASELPSGDITQDGITYIPLTGQPLQTESVELPIPPKYYNPYERPNGEAGLIVPIVLADRNEESLAAEHAAGGAGPLLEGSETLTSGCTGPNACDASYNRCELRWALQEMKYGLMVAGGSISCTRAVHVMQIEVCIYAENYTNGHYYEVECNGDKGVTGYNARFGLSTVQSDCAPGINYKSWTWGYASGGSLWFGGGGINSPAYRCEHDFTGEVVESIETFL
jgi:YD repeat-containing protein